MALSLALLIALPLLWESVHVAEGQVYAYEEDYDRGYPGAGPYGYYHNICNFECPDVWSPVCATDGYSYPSGCHLFVASCWKQILGQKGTRFWYRGTCLLEGSTNYDPQPGLKKREEEERQKKIDAGEWVPTTPPTDAIYINGQPYLPPYNPAPTSAPATPPPTTEVDAGDEEEEEEVVEDEEEIGDEADEGVETEVEAETSTARSFSTEETPIESRRRRRRRSLLRLLDQSSSHPRPRRRHRRHQRRQQRRRRREDDCQWACPLTPEPLCGSDGKTHFNKCHFLRHKCRVDAAEKSAFVAAADDREGDGVAAAEVGAAAAVAEDAAYAKATFPADEESTREVADGAFSNNAVNEASDGIVGVSSDPDGILGAEVAHPEVEGLVVRHAGRCGRFADAADERVRECVDRCGRRSEDEEIRPVCASDGKTYPNFCFYRQAKCLAYLNEKLDINFYKMGFCE